MVTDSISAEALPYTELTVTSSGRESNLALIFVSLQESIVASALPVGMVPVTDVPEPAA